MKIKNSRKSLITFIFLLISGGFLVFYLTKSKSISFENSQIITVFKSPTCACCGDYVAYLKKEGFGVKVVNTNDTLSIKEKYKIPSEMESCHTAVIGNYFIEGHVPIEAIKKLLSEKPAIDGISLPGMPSGSPGMSGVKVGSWKIYSLSNGQPSEFLSL